MITVIFRCLQRQKKWTYLDKGLQISQITTLPRRARRGVHRERRRIPPVNKAKLRTLLLDDYMNTNRFAHWPIRGLGLCWSHGQ